MPPKQGLEALKKIYKKNPAYFDQFSRDVDRRAVEVLGPLFGIDEAVWKQFREEYLGSEAERALARLHQQLAGLLEETRKFIRAPKRSSAGLAAGPRRRRRKGVRRTRLTPAEKEARSSAKKLRLEAHKLVLKIAKGRDVSPALVYRELTKKYGRKAKDADAKELASRIAFLKSKA